jgi:hypothetical protein
MSSNSTERVLRGSSQHTDPLANAIRALAMDAVQQANSGHPGAPMGMAEMAVALWNRHLRHNPGNPHWPDRDRFVLSNGHASMILYALLHLSGYELPISELKRFRQLHSKTPGHPEVGITVGIETTTGPLGQGVTNAVGMALAEKLLGDQFNQPGHTLVTVRADELGNAQGIGLDQTHPGLLGALQKLAHARIAARSLEIDFDDGLRGGLQTHADGVKAEKNFGGRHGAVLSRRLRQTWDSQGHVWVGS